MLSLVNSKGFSHVFFFPGFIDEYVNIYIYREIDMFASAINLYISPASTVGVFIQPQFSTYGMFRNNPKNDSDVGKYPMEYMGKMVHNEDKLMNRVSVHLNLALRKNSLKGEVKTLGIS